MQGRSVFHDTESGEEAVDSVGVFSQRGGDIGGLGKPQGADGSVAKGGQSLSGRWAADAIGVFPEGRVANPVKPVFNVPMIPPPREQPRGAGLCGSRAGDRVGGFDRFDALAPNPPSQTTDPLMARPIECVR